ncbi:MAG: dTDP-4-dehydrorhamnose reductase [Gemmatimonadaceae bacterium]
MTIKKYLRNVALITGGGGQLANALVAQTPETWEAKQFARRELDITSAREVSAAIAEFRPRVILNAAAFTRVDLAETERTTAFSVNEDGVANLATMCAQNACRLIHVSTDYVFGGGEGNVPYSVADEPSPINTYGESKLAGERWVRQLLPDLGLIVRTSWLYSAQPPNFVLTILNLINQRAVVKVVSDQIGSPTWAEGLAQTLWRAADTAALSGVLHWTDAGAASWYEFALAIEEESRQLGLVHTKGHVVQPISAAEYPTLAKRPRYTVLSSRETCARLRISQTPWRTQLRTMLEGIARD